MNKKLHVRKGDNVIVLSGKDKGKKGKVLSVMPKSGKVIVEGVAVATKHKNQDHRQMLAASYIRKHQFTLVKLCIYATNAVSLQELHVRFLKMVQLLVFAKNVMKFYNLIIIGKEETISYDKNERAI